MNKRLGSTIFMALVVAGAAAPQSTWKRAVPTHEEGKNTVGEMSEEVARVRLQKLGYSNIQQLARTGDYWRATAAKNGSSWQISLHARTGAREEKPIAAKPK
jgi:hypothetical protein